MKPDKLGALLSVLKDFPLADLKEAVEDAEKYREAFFALVGLHVGEPVVLTEAQNDRDGAWFQLRHLNAGMIGKIQDIQWNIYREPHEVVVTWEPQYEALWTPAEYEKRHHPWPADYEKLTEPERAAIIGRREVWRKEHGKEPECYCADPERNHTYSIRAKHVRPATADEVARANGGTVTCLKCGTVTRLYDLVRRVFHYSSGQSASRMEPATAEQISSGCGTYASCPTCDSYNWLVLTDPLWETP